MTTDFEIDFLNFAPAPGFKIYAEKELCKLMALAPAKSLCTATIQKTGDLFRCRLVISDMCEPIYTTAFGETPQAALVRASAVTAEKVRARAEGNLDRAHATPLFKYAVGHA
jgi:hypothetical protein